jgi:hypothetical protein
MDAPLQTATHLGKHLGSGGATRCELYIDGAVGRIFLYGRWDGERSLDGFWVYSIAEGQRHMTVEPRNDSAVWPGWRSCHKMAFDAGTGRIYLLGCLAVGDDGLREIAKQVPMQVSCDHRRNGPIFTGIIPGMTMRVPESSFRPTQRWIRCKMPTPSAKVEEPTERSMRS